MLMVIKKASGKRYRVMVVSTFTVASQETHAHPLLCLQPTYNTIVKESDG
jgi:hypothetical protein